MIADEVVKGVYSFEVGRWTGVMTDWCKNGIGYVLVQKYCNCTDITPICCTGGWKVYMVGSRFTSAAEQLWKEGVVDGLHKMRYYTQGCDKLLVGVDHKPLLGLLQGKRLEDIDNMRLRRLVEKNLWVEVQGSPNSSPPPILQHLATSCEKCSPLPVPHAAITYPLLAFLMSKALLSKC